MLANLRKHGKSSHSKSEVSNIMSSDGVIESVPGRSSANVVSHYSPDPTLPYTPEELGFNWSAHINQSHINHSTMPVWLQEGVMSIYLFLLAS
jgi:hypothetical protein